MICEQVRGYFGRNVWQRLKKCFSTAAARTRYTAKRVSKTEIPRISQNQSYEKNFVKFPTEAFQSLCRTYNSDSTALERATLYIRLGFLIPTKAHTVVICILTACDVVGYRSSTQIPDILVANLQSHNMDLHCKANTGKSFVIYIV